MKKRIAMLLAAMLLSSCAIAQADEAHSHKICGGGLTSDCRHAVHGSYNGVDHTDTVTWTPWDGTKSIAKMLEDANSNRIYLYLTTDIRTKDIIVIPGNNKEVYLCLNGYSIIKTEPYTMTWNSGKGEYDYFKDTVINVNNYFCLTDCSVQQTGEITHDIDDPDKKQQAGNGIQVYGSMDMYGGNVTGNKTLLGRSGGVVLLGDTFRMYGGSITNNMTDDNIGAGLTVEDHKAEIYGGTITENYVLTDEETKGTGSGIYVGKNGSLTIGGKGVNIFGNKYNTSEMPTDRNVYLGSRSIIKLAGNFDAANSGPIGVTHADAPANPEEGTQIPFLEKVGGSVTLDEVKRFVSDNPNYTTTVIDGKGYLVKGPLSFTIAYDLDGGKLPEGKGNPETYTENDAFTLHNPEKEGFTFEGWTGTGLSAATKEVTIPKDSYGDRTYKATWKAIVIPPQPISPEEALQAADLPKTGDHSGLAFWMTVLLAAGSAAFVFCRKRV